MAHRSHVPKFGNWDREDEYTAYFETARKEKDLNSMTMVNPNDPEQNPEAFNFVTGATASAGGSDGSMSRNSNGSLGRGSRRRNPTHQRSRESNGSFTPESVSSRSNHSDHSVLQQRRENKRSISRGGGSVGRAGSFSSSGYHRRESGSHSSRESEQNQKVGAVPKLGEWDEKDPKSGESFTVIFSKLKQEKHTEPDHLPDAPSQFVQFSNVPKPRQRPPPKNTKPKYCCFFN